MNLDELLAFINDLPDRILVNLNINLAVGEAAPVEPEPEPEPEPAPPPPPPVSTVFVTVVRQPHANLRLVTGYDTKDKPIMQIYPRDNAPVSERIQIPVGARLAVINEAIMANGGDIYYALYDSSVYASVQLYVRQDDVD